MAAPAVEETVRRLKEARDWNERVEEVRRVPEIYGQRQRSSVYAAMADAFYKEHLAAHFAFVLWRDEYELEPFVAAYDEAHRLTNGFRRADASHLASVLSKAPRTLLIFRTIVGYTPGELAAAASMAAEHLGLPGIQGQRIKSIEAGSHPSEGVARTLAEAIHHLMTGTLWGAAVGNFRSKLDKPDTVKGWRTVQRMAEEGVPYSFLLHQRHYGGTFRTLLDATSTLRGDILLEVPVEQLLSQAHIPHVRTGAHNQREIEERFNLTVRPAPDFVVFERERTLRAMIECKQANDGGTARDKAARFGRLAEEGRRLGGVPVFAVLDGLGWRRTGDALGPVVRDTDGRVFMLDTLPEMLTVQPFPALMR